MTYLVDMAEVAKKTLKGKKDNRELWDEETKRTVVQMFDKGATNREVSEITGVYIDNLMMWKKTDWYKQYQDELRKEKRQELNSRLSAIVNAALSKIEDRLENGDYVLNNKTGEIVRKPVSLRDANLVAKDLLGEQLKIHKMDQNQLEFSSSAQDILKGLAKEFAKFNQRLKREGAEDIQFREVSDPNLTIENKHE